MGAVGEPLNSAGLILQGGQQLNQSLGQVAQQQKAEAEANRPVHPIMQQYIERIMAGEDPDRLAQEAQRHPGMQDLLGGRGQPQQAQPIGPQPGPQMALGGPQAPQPVAQQARPSASAPAQSLGALSGMAQMGQPIQGAPAVTPQAAGASGSAPMPPPSPTQSAPIAPEMGPNGPQNGPPQGGQMAPRRGQLPPISQRDYAQMAPLLQLMSTQQGRIQVAQTAAEARAQVAELQAQNRMLIAQMNEAGRGQRAEQSSQDKAEGRKTQETIAAGRNTTSSANVAARNATSRANTQDIVAGGITRTGMQGQTSRENVATRVTGGGNKLTPEQQILLKEATQARDAAERLGRIGSFDQGPTWAADVRAARAKADALSAEVRATIPQGAGVSAGTGKIQIRMKDGRTGRVHPDEFDPATMTKL